MPNTAQDGFARQAAAVAGSSNAVADTGRCQLESQAYDMARLTGNWTNRGDEEMEAGD